MRFVKFTEVSIRPIDKNKAGVIHLPRIVVAEHVTSVGPGAIPSEISGGDGQPMRKEAATLTLPGEQIVVTCTVEQALWKLKTEDMEVKEPEKLDAGGN